MSQPSADTEVRLFHLATPKNAANILRVGFLNGTGRYLTDAEYSGVWLTNDPERVEGAIGDTRLVVDLNIRREELDQFEWKNDGGTYREWLIPAGLLKEHIASLVVEEVDP